MSPSMTATVSHAGIVSLKNCLENPASLADSGLE